MHTGRTIRALALVTVVMTAAVAMATTTHARRHAVVDAQLPVSPDRLTAGSATTTAPATAVAPTTSVAPRPATTTSTTSTAQRKPVVRPAGTPIRVLLLGDSLAWEAQSPFVFMIGAHGRGHA